MNVFDIIGPVMVGPSSSHTAGAVRIGYISRKLIGEPIKEAKIYLHGSFYMTGKGHGTDLALIAGLLGMKPDDTRIPSSFVLAEEQNLTFSFHEISLKNVHPNSCELRLIGHSGRKLTIIGSSLGGGLILIVSIDGLTANFSGDFPTLIVHNIDQPGHVAKVTNMLAEKGINIANMQLYRKKRGLAAVMILECDQEVPKEYIRQIEALEGINKVTYLSLDD